MGRALTWGDPVIFDLASNNFVPVVGDDWYQRRRDDDEGTFYRKVSNQGPRKNVGDATRQGIYVFSAGGILLGFKNHQDPNVMRQFLRDSLKSWQQLPASERVPKAVQVVDVKKIDVRYHRALPIGGAVINVYTRILDKKSDGSYCPGSCKFPGGDKSAHDHLWILPEELPALLPATAKTGDRFPLPARLSHRIARFHLVDNTRGEPPFWSAKQVHDANLTATVESFENDTIKLKIEGKFLLATHDKKSDRGYDVHLLGFATGNPKTKKLDRFDVMALGDHWGQGPYTPGARPGRTPLGVALVLSPGTAPSDRVPPQAAREWNAYVRAEP